MKTKPIIEDALSLAEKYLETKRKNKLRQRRWRKKHKQEKPK